MKIAMAITLGLCVALGAAGCGGGSESDPACSSGCGYSPLASAVYVMTSTNGGSGAADCGAFATPCASIQAAIDRAVALGKTRVLVSDGAYLENLELRDGISVEGGYDHVTWEQSIAANVTVLFGQPQASALHYRAVSIRDIGTATAFRGFHVFGAVNAQPGGSSYAVYVEDSFEQLAIRGNVLFAASGGGGTSGASGLDGASRTTQKTVTGAALPGVVGANSTAASTTTGGSGAANTCGGTANVGGGAGGDSGLPSVTIDSGCNRAANQEGTGDVGSGVNPGTGGNGGQDTTLVDSCWTCLKPSGSSEGSDGSDGASGSGGDGGAGGASAGGSQGTVEAGGWTSFAGLGGSDGTDGSGGGGGGAGGGQDRESSDVYCGDIFPAYDACNDAGYLFYGATGGGGGAGGCKATGGAAGQPGGGSFGLFLVYTSPLADAVALPEIVGNTIYRGYGGDGGDGGLGGVGQPGGDGGEGGLGDFPADGVAENWCTARAGSGGSGGGGGHGGGGGGANGGASVGLFVFDFTGAAPAWETSNTFPPTGGGGLGGRGGRSLGSSGGDGADGLHSAVAFVLP